MGLFEVKLGVDRAARDTGRRLTVRVWSTDPLSAALRAEALANARLKHPDVEYTHAMRVTPIIRPLPPAMPAMPIALAA